MNNIFELVTDTYERKARVTPGLLVTLPVLIPLIGIYGMDNPFLTAIITLIGGSGAIFALASIARGRGKKLEEILVNEWGGMPTTIALRHRDTFLDRVSKKEYHQLIKEKLGIELPTAEEEEAAPDQADETYIGATSLIRGRTRTNNSLLLKENIAYGFHRNMVAMKDVGILTCIIGIIYGMSIGNILQLSPPYLILNNLNSLGLVSGLSLTVSFTMLSSWIFYFNKESVKRIGFVYAERLFECLYTIK